MQEAIGQLRKKYAGRQCVADRLQKDGCRLLNPPRCRLILDLDKKGAPVAGRAPGKKCDYLLYACCHEALVFSPIEMKRTIRDMVFVDQLQNGARIGEKEIGNWGNQVHLIPICVHNGIRRGFRNRLRRNPARIRFLQGRNPIPVMLVKSGHDLQDMLDERLVRKTPGPQKAGP